MNLVNWNVKTLFDSDNRPERQIALVAKTLDKYEIDTAALSETVLSGEGSLNELGQKNTYFWRSQSHIHGVGTANKNTTIKSLHEHLVGHSERLITVRIPLERANFVTIISAYAPTLAAEEETKGEFCSSILAVLEAVDRRDNLVLMGDFSARVGSDYYV